MKLNFTKFRALIVLVLSTFIINSVDTKSQEFKIVFDYYDNVKEYNINEISELDFASIQNNYFLNIYTKTEGRVLLETKNIKGILFEDNLMTLNIQGNTSIFNISDLDSLSFRTYSEENYSIKELELDEVILTGLGNAWSLAFIDEFNVLINDKSGRLIFYNMYTKSQIEVQNLPEIKDNGQGGLLDVKLHPNFNQNFIIFLSHAVAVGNNQTTVVTRALLNLDEMKLENAQEIFRAVPAVNSTVHFGSRISFDKDNNVYISTGERGNSNNAQNTLNHWGKIMRVTEFGKVPADNPFVSSNLHLPEIWSYGHRNVQGMDTHPITGELWAHEHGPQGGDELNLIKKGANYGWPLATFGINYNGTEITKDTTYPGCEDPITYWKPSIAPCGMTFVKNNKTPNEADILVGALAGQHIARVHIVDNKVVNQIRSLQNYARFRDVKQSPDGRIYAVTENGRLIRLKEKK